MDDNFWAKQAQISSSVEFTLMMPIWKLTKVSWNHFFCTFSVLNSAKNIQKSRILQKSAVEKFCFDFEEKLREGPGLKTALNRKLRIFGHVITREGPHFQAVCLKLRTLASDHVISKVSTNFQTRSLSNKSKQNETKVAKVLWWRIRIQNQIQGNLRKDHENYWKKNFRSEVKLVFDSILTVWRIQHFSVP